MANFGKRPINDANAYKRKADEFMFNGERALDRRPFGRCERFVDPVGNVITLQLSTPGDPAAVMTAMRKRAQKHNDGWIEHAKCPLRHGHDQLTPDIVREFKKMPKELSTRCESDPKVMARIDGELHAQESCPHIEWLIKFRVEKEKAEKAKRNKAQILAEKRKEEADALQAAQLEMVKEQIEERKARKRGEKKAPTE